MILKSRDILSSKNVLKRLFFFRKKMIVFFIFAAMSVNGFAPSTMELGKFSFVLVLAAVTHNTVITVLGRCRDSLTIMSNVLSGNICGIMFKLKTSENPAQKKKGKEEKKNTTGDYAVVQLHKESERKTISHGYKFRVFASGSLMLSGFTSNFLLADVIGSGGGFLILLIFLVFICAVRHRKGLSGNSIIDVERKIKISA